MEGITDAMKQYWKGTEDLWIRKQKRSKEFGVRTPDAPKIIAVLTVIFMVIVLAAEFV